MVYSPSHVAHGAGLTALSVQAPNRLYQLLPAALRRELDRRHELRAAFFNVNWLLGQKFFETLVGLVIGVWVARYLGPERYGTLSYVVAFITLFTPLALNGLGNILIRDLVQKPEDTPKLLGTGVLVRLAGSLLLVALAVPGVMLFRPDDTAVIAYVAIVGAAHVVRSFGVVESWFSAQTQSKYVVLSRAIPDAIVAIVRVGLIFSQASLTSFVLAYVLDLVLQVVMLQFYYARTANISPRAWRGDLETFKHLARDGWPLVISGFMSLISMKIDQIMLGSMLNDEKVGIYAAAVKIVDAFIFIPSFIVTSVFPALVRARRQGVELYQERFQCLYDVFVWGGLLLATLVTLSAPLLIRVLFGADFAEAAPVLGIYVWCTVFWFAGSAGHRYLISENLARLSLVMTATGAAVNVLLNLILIPRYGVIGAAWATVCSFAFSHWLAALLVRDSRILVWFFLSSLNPRAVIRRWRALLFGSTPS